MSKQAYRQSLEDKLATIDRHTEALTGRLDHDGALDDHARVEMRGTLARLDVRRRELQEKLAGLHGEPEHGTWESIKTRVEQDWDDMMAEVEERLQGSGSHSGWGQPPHPTHHDRG